MIAAFLITFREVIEASLIVATILGILARFRRQQEIKTVWLATVTALAVSLLLLTVGSIFGFKVKEIFTGRIEAVIEGFLMVVSAIFITWAVFFLHNYFARYKTSLLIRIKDKIEGKKEDHHRGLFWLTFTAVFREGFEIVLFLTTVYLASEPRQILLGFFSGLLLALVTAVLLFTATLKIPVRRTFQVTSGLLILFAGGLLARGFHEFSEAGFLPSSNGLTFSFLPEKNTFAAEMIKAVLGLSRQMEFLPLLFYAGYILFMTWRVFFVGTSEKNK